MADLVLTGVNEEVLHQLQKRADMHGRTPEEEAKTVLAEVLQEKIHDGWER
ncbi:MAG: hypothetical protein KY476_12720 [Planctomycetes bacterium]|nr:hypothetical protein [Planctomycetota bacterium]